MAHPVLYSLVADVAAAIDLPEPIVEFGSMQVEDGQPNDLRPIFAGRDFTGTDFREGPGVDRVEDLRSLSYADGEVGTALCLDTLEHCEDPITACRELHRVLKPGGICLITSVLLFGIHGYPNDYFRFTPEGLRVLLKDFDGVDVAGMGATESPIFVFGIGGRGSDPGVRLDQLPSLTQAQDRFDQAKGKVKLGAARYSLRDLGREVVGQLPRVARERIAERRSSD